MQGSGVATGELVVLQGEVEWGGGLVASIPMWPGRYACGRRAGSDIVLHDETVSRHQFDLEISESGEAHLIVPAEAADLLVGGFRIGDRHLLAPGDCIQAGEIMLRLTGASPRRPRAATMSVATRERSKFTVLDRTVLDRTMRYEGRNTLRLLAQLGDSLREIEDPPTVRRNLLSLVREHLPVSRVLLALTQARGDELIPECWDLGEVTTAETPHFEMSAGLLQHIRQSDCVCVVEEVSDLALGHSVAAAGIRSAMGAALREGDQVRGVLYADNLVEAVKFSEEDRAFFTVMAGLVATTLSTSRRLAAVVKGAAELREGLDSREPMLGSSAVMATVSEHARRFARLRSAVLILGERGTGKTLAARYIHRQSPRPEGPFVHVNCASIPANLAEAELFGIGKDAGVAGVGRAGRSGHVQKADGGTLFLDEIADLPLEVQPKLLVALREGFITPVGGADPIQVDVRLITASNRALDTESGAFRHDLLDRISALRLDLPPLRERSEDIPILARYLLARILADEGIERTLSFSEAAMRELSRRTWPGNVAELENAIRHAVAFTDGDLVDLQDLPPASDAPGALPQHGLRTLAEVEREHIAAVLDRLEWNKRQAALVLSISRNTLDRKIQDHDLTPPPGIPLRGSRRKGAGDA